MVGPAATAYLLSNRLKTMLGLTVVFGILASVSGYYLAKLINGSIAGAIATMIGVLFALTFIYVRLRKRIQAAGRRPSEYKGGSAVW